MKQAPLQDIRILQGILFIFTLFSIKRNCNLYAKARRRFLVFWQSNALRAESKKAKARTKALAFSDPAVENSDFLLKKVYLYVII